MSGRGGRRLLDGGIVPAVLVLLRSLYRVRQPGDLYSLLYGLRGDRRVYKMNASISGAEVGCQGEVGVACSMAA
ncbi:hypothetical protein CKJ90_30190, partial [Klebsiella pneumoniae]